MLASIRKNARNRVFQVILGLIIFVFAFYFGYGTFRDTKKTYAVTVNGTGITAEQYNDSYRRLESFYRRNFGDQIPQELFDQLGLKDRALDLLIDRVLLLKTADEMGIKVTEDELNAAIKSQPAFAENGVFNQDRYMAILRANNYTHDQYKAERREELLLTKTQEAIKSSAVVSDAEVEEEFRNRNTQITADYVAFKPENFVSSAFATDEKLSEFLKTRGEMFRTPERRSAKYVFLPSTRFMGEVAINDKQLEQEYQARAALFYDEVQKRQKPLAQVKDELALLVKREKARELAFKAADNLLMDIEDKKTSWEKLSPSVTPLIAKGETHPAIPQEKKFFDALFALSPSASGEVIEGAEGVYLIAIAVAQPSEIPPLARIREQVKSEWAKVEAVKLAKEAAKRFAQSARDGNWGSAVAAGRYTSQTTQPFNKKSDSIQPLGASQEAKDALFANLSPGFVPQEGFEIGEAAYAFRIANISMPNMGALEAEREKIRQELLPAKGEQVLADHMKQLREKASIDYNVAFFPEKALKPAGAAAEEPKK
jgi:peptidyl-prolyl cis-trans isomerase D